MHLRDIAGNAEEEEVNPKDIVGNAEEEGEPQMYSWERRRRKKKDLLSY